MNSNENEQAILYCTNTPFLVSETFLRKTRDYLASIFDVRIVSTARNVGGIQALPSHFLGIRDDSIFNRTLCMVLGILFRKPREQVRLEVHKRRIRSFFNTNNISAQAGIVEYGTAAYVFAPVLKEKKIPFVITFHGYDCSMYLRFQWYRDEIVELCKSSIAVVVPSNHLRRRLQLIGVPERKITVEPCVPLYSDLPKTTSTAKLKVVALGRLTEKKCPEALVHTARLVLQQFSEAHFHIIGNGPLRSRVESLVKEFKLEESVTLHGAVEHTTAMQLLSSATVFIQHSVTSSSGDQEGFPVAIAEALSMGIPVVSTYHSGITEAITHGVSGHLVQEHDFEEMARWVGQLLADENLRRTTGANGKEKISKIAGPLSREKKLAAFMKAAIDADYYSQLD